MEHDKRIKDAVSIHELFEIVREIAGDYTGFKRERIKIRWADLSSGRNQLIGAFYNFMNNMIVINTSPVNALNKKNPDAVNYYLFHILLHEYIHSLGVTNERKTRWLAYRISMEYFGKEHMLTKIASNIGYVLADLKEEPSHIQNEDPLSQIFSDLEDFRDWFFNGYTSMSSNSLISFLSHSST